MTLECNDAILTGIEEIDKQHKELFNMVNQLKGNQADRNEVTGFLVSMQKHLVNHFRTEEAYMLKINYEDYEAHKLMHDQFTLDLERMLKDVSSSESLLSNVPVLLYYAEEWTIDHCNKADIKLANALREYYKSQA